MTTIYTDRKHYGRVKFGTNKDPEYLQDARYSILCTREQLNARKTETSVLRRPEIHNDQEKRGNFDIISFYITLQ